MQYIYADEADLLNIALFGITAKEWRDAHPNKEGNICDEARSFTSWPFARTQQNRYYPNENFGGTSSKTHPLENKTPRVASRTGSNTGSFIVLLAN